MIEFDVSKVLQQPGVPFKFSYDGVPDIPDVEFLSPLRLDVTMEAVGQGDIRAAGQFHTEIGAQCDRCLADIQYKADATFDEVFVKAGSEEPDDYSYTGEAVVLDKLVYDAIILDLPQQLLCGEECAGLCPKCGKDLNEGKCDCNTGGVIDPDNPFAKLKDLI